MHRTRATVTEGEVVLLGLAEDDVLGVVGGEGVAGLFEGLGQAGLADDEGGADRALRGQEPGRGHRRGEQVRFRDVQPAAGEPVRQLPRGVLGVVGDHHEAGVRVEQPLDELLGAGDRVDATDQDAVHVEQEVLRGGHD